jgi:DNA-binding SARP family transcriptional activator
VLEFRLLGPLEVLGEDGPITVAGQRQRALLAILLLRANEVVASESLVALLWGEEPPRTAPTSLQNAVANLRKLLGSSVLLTKVPGYVLDVDREQIDLGRFQRLVAEARPLPPQAKVAALRSALALWRGDPLADLAYEAWAQNEVHRLDELRLAAQEELLDAELELGNHAAVVAEAEPLVHEHPLRERVRGQLMLGLYGSGRQAEATASYREARLLLRDELGLDPGPELQALYESILRQDSSLLPMQTVRLDDQVAEVVKALATGRLVPVLGPGVANDELAAMLAERFECPPAHAVGLAWVSQYVTARNGVGPLWDELHSALDRDAEPDPLHAWLASLPPLFRERGLPHQLVVTTALDTAVERAFADAGEELDVVSYIAAGRDRGRFLHTAPDGAAVVVDQPNAYDGLSLERRSVLLKVHGGVDRGVARERESFAVSEDDHIDYLAADAGGTVPVTLAARLRRSHLLFLGYRVDDWSLRVFLRRVWGRDRLAYRSWAVQPAAEGVARELWRERDVEVYDCGLAEYAVELDRRTRDLLPADAAVCAAPTPGSRCPTRRTRATPRSTTPSSTPASSSAGSARPSWSLRT